MSQICKELDLVKICKVFMILFSQITSTLNAKLIVNICELNNKEFMKVIIVKDIIAPLLEYINI